MVWNKLYLLNQAQSIESTFDWNARPRCGNCKKFDIKWHQFNYPERSY